MCMDDRAARSVLEVGEVHLSLVAQIVRHGMENAMVAGAMGPPARDATHLHVFSPVVRQAATSVPFPVNIKAGRSLGDLQPVHVAIERETC